MRWFTGSVADEVLRNSNVPVLVVRAEDIAWAPDRGQPRVLVGLDGSEFSETGLAAAADLRMHWPLNYFSYGSFSRPTMWPRRTPRSPLLP